MTLSKQMVLLVMTALSMLFIGTFLITTYYSKLYFEEQLVRNSQDTATALGLSLSVLEKENTAAALSQINAVFNRGYFSAIYTRDTAGKIIIKRYYPPSYSGAPSWFVKWVNIHNEAKSALVMKGWQQIGEVVVEGDSSLAYAALWITVKKLFFLFFLLTVVLILISVSLIKIMFRPLKRIVQQAQDIGKKNFYTVDKMPSLTELKQLAYTMNSMVVKLKMFYELQLTETERMRAQVYKDSLTGYGNRRYFFQQLKYYLKDEEHFQPGYIFLIELTGIDLFNKEFGYYKGDQALIEFCQALNENIRRMNLALLARLDGPHFAAIILEDNEILIEELAKSLVLGLNRKLGTIHVNLSCYLGIVKCHYGEELSQILTRADSARKLAQDKSKKYYIEKDTIAIPRSTQELKALITQSIRENGFTFYCQPVSSSQSDTTYHYEGLIKMVNDSTEMAAREFIYVADEYNLTHEIDLLVLQKIVELNTEKTMAINISSSTIMNRQHREKFIEKVKDLVHTRKIKMHFEISEYILEHYLEEAQELINHLVHLGQVVGLDRVGATLIPLKHLNKLNINYIKLEGFLSKELNENKLKEEFISNLKSTADKLDIILIATAIESEKQYNQLKQLGVIYFQGNYIGNLIPLNNSF